MWHKRNKTERVYTDANKLSSVRKDILHKKRLMEVEINKIKEEVKPAVSKIGNNVENREEYGEKDTIKIESEDEEILLGFDSDGEAVVRKDCQAVVEDLFQKEEEAIKKVDKDPTDDHCGDEGLEQELWNEEIENIEQRILNELGVVQEMKMKDREPLNTIHINKKAKAPIELGNLATRSIIQEICCDLTKYNKVLYATAKVMTELCSDCMKTKTKKNRHRQKTPMWKEKIEREIEHK